MKPITRLRAHRTRAFTSLRSTIDLCLRQKAPHTMPNGLPSWWPFWSDQIVRDTKALVRAARLLAPVEGIDLSAPGPKIKACPWGGCNGTGPEGGVCNRCGTAVDFPYVQQGRP